ncbi:uncharacterized protein LOC105828686 isoform X2 [Monomorium pharaonis]|uniref:uncharacterized protein LOC105828686 isoform X2 n=1 Tax=Monomorium pharaonis TaxID=307658 RepID=UPI001747AF18|nr:uncharacterized protein LOC105828686 isoform X2 [Monomorium pharaonis]
MSAGNKRETHFEANETEPESRCCELFEYATHDHKHLKPACIIARKLPALSIKGYVCRGCRRELHKGQEFRYQKENYQRKIGLAVSTIMARYKKRATCILNNFQLKRWHHGNKGHRIMLLVKLKHDMRKLGLSKRATRAGLMQLAIRPSVILKRLSIFQHREKPLQLLQNSNQNFVSSYKEKSQCKHRGNAVEKRRTTEDFREIKTDKPEIKEFSPIRTKLVDALQKSTIINTFSECNVNSSNVTIPELKTYSQEKANNFTVENQNAQLDLELVEHIDTSLYHKTIKKDVSRTKINLESKNQSTDNLHIEKNSKAIIKRQLSSESLLRNVLPAKIQKKNEINTSPDKVVADSIIESSDSITIDHMKQRIWKDVTKCMIKKKENYKSFKRKKEQKKNKYKKIKNIREKFRVYFGSLSSNTSESEEEREILLNYVKKKKQFDDPLHGNTSEEEDTREGHKKLTRDASTNLQKNIGNINSDNAYKSTASIEKYAMHDVTKDSKIQDETSINERVTLVNNLQENDNSDNSCNSTVSTKKYYAMHDATTDTEKEDRALTSTRSMLANNLQKNAENDNSDSLCDSITCIKKYYTMHNAATDEINGVSIYKRDTSINNTHENTKDIDSKKSACNFSANIEKCYTEYDITMEEDVEDGASRWKYNKSPQNSSKNIDVVIAAEIIPVKEQRLENSSSIDIENNSKSVRIEKSKDITPSTIEMDLDEKSMEDIHLDRSIEKKTTYMFVVQNHQKTQEACNNKSVDLTQDIRRYTTSKLELPITFAHELLCNVNEKDSCNVSQNAKNLLLANNDNNLEDGETSLLDQSPVTSKKNSSEKKDNSSSTSSNKSDCNDSHLDNYSTDDDNSSDLDVEIKIKLNKSKNTNKNKLKSRVSQKFSLKAPWSAVNSCIENLHTLKDNPNFFNKLFEMSHKTSERSKSMTSKSPEDKTSLDDKQDMSAEIIYNSVSTLKDNASCSQQPNFQDSPILNKDKNAMEVSQKETDNYMQSVKETIQITTENDPGSSKLACNMSDLAKQVEKASTDDNQKTNKEQNQNDTILEEATSMMEHNQQQVQKVSTDDKQKINEEQNQSNTILEETRSIVKHNQQKENKCISFIEQKKIQTVTENNPGSNKAAYNTPDLGEQPLQTFSNATYCQSAISSQLISSRSRSQSAPHPSVSVQLSQLAHPLVFPQLTPAQSTIHPSVSPQLAFSQSAPRPLVSPQLISQSAPHPSTFPQSALIQSAPRSSISLQSIRSAPIRSGSRPSISPQSTPRSSIFSQLAYQARHPSVPLQTYPQLASQSVSQQLPSYNTADNQIYSSRANAPITPVEINAPNINNEHNNTIIQNTIKNVCTYVGFCRDFIRCRLLRTHISVEFIQKLSIYVMQIKQDLEKLQVLLRMKDIQDVITYVNQYMLFDQMLTYTELCKYIYLIRSYRLYATQILQQNARSNASHNSNISESVPNTSMSNVNTQPFLRNVSFPDPRIPNHNRSTQFTAIPHQMPTISNINQQQLFDNAANYPRVSYSRQITSNICQQHVSHACVSRTHSRISNTNKEQPLENPIQNQYTLSTNISNIGTQQIPMSMSNISSSNTNMHSYGPINQENINMPPINNTKCTRQSRTVLNKFVNSTASASAANAQQQRQYFQLSQINSRVTVCPLSTNQNVPPEIRQTAHNITSPGTLTVNSDAPRTDTMRNVKYGSVNVNHQQAIPQVFQASSERMQFLSQNNLNPNEVYNIMPQPMVICNMPTYSVQNASSNQNMQQIPQPVNQANVNIFPAINTERSNVASKNTISNTETATCQQLQSQGTSTCAIDLSISNTSQNVRQNVPNKEIKILESQNKNHMRKKVPFINPQQKENSSAHNILQNISNTALKTSTSQNSNVPQNMISTMSLQTRNKAFILPNITQTNQVIYNFNLSNFTDIQKILLHDQIQSYFQISNKIERFLNKQEHIHHEKTTLFNLYQHLHNYIKNLIKESQTTEKYVKKNSQNKSQSKSVLEKNMIQTPVNKSTKTQSNRDNKNSPVHNSNLEKQSLKQNIDSDISKNSKLTAPKNNLKVQNKESLLTPDFAIIEKSLPKDIRLQEPNNNVLKEKLKEKLQKSLLVEKQPKTIETLSPSYLKISEKNVFIEAEYSKTEAQDNARINESPKANALTGKTKDQAEIAKNNANERSNNMKTENGPKTSNVAISDNNAENNAPLRFSCNTKDQNNEAYNSDNKISNKNLQNEMRDNVKESVGILSSTEIQSDPLTLSHGPEPSSLNSMLESASSRKKYKYTEITQATRENHAKTISKFFLTQQEDPINEWSDNSSDGTSESSLKLYIDESPEKSQKQEQCDEVSSSEEDNLNASQASVSRLFNAIKYKSTKITQIHIAHEEHVETMSELCLNAQQEDPTNKWNSSDGTSKNSRKYIDKNPEKPQKHECDKVSSSKEDNNLNTSQVSPPRLFNVITKYESTKKTEVHVTHEEHAETTSEFCLNVQQDFSNNRDNDSIYETSESPKKVYVDESIKNTEVILSFSKNISEANLADVSQEFSTEAQDAENAEEENNKQSLLNMEKIYLPEMLLKFEVPEEASSMEENTMQSMYLPENSDDIRELFEDIEEEKLIIDTHNNINASNEHGKKEEIIIDTHSDINMTNEYMDEIKMMTDTHNGINMTNEHFQHVSEQKYHRKFQRSACNSVQEDNPDLNKNKEIFAENNVLNTNIVECISIENYDNSEVVEIMPSILNVRSISPSLFEKLDNMNLFSQNDLKMLNKNDRKLMNINNDLEISDVIDKPCLRCKRKSTVCCQACLEAHYCSKRCSSLHWNAEHYKKCKGSITCIDLV